MDIRPPKLCGGKNKNLLTDLIHTPSNIGRSNPTGYAKDVGKELKEIRNEWHLVIVPPSGPWQIHLKKGI